MFHTPDLGLCSTKGGRKSNEREDASMLPTHKLPSGRKVLSPDIAGSFDLDSQIVWPLLVQYVAASYLELNRAG